MSADDVQPPPPGPFWWIAVEGRQEGPLTEAELCGRLKAGAVPPAAFACPAGGDRWRPVAEWPALAPCVPPPPPGSPPPLPASGSPLTSDRLPPFANWVCVYAMVAAPLLWMASNLSCCVTGVGVNPDSPLFDAYLGVQLFFSAASLLVVLSLAAGGLQLRALKSSGPRLLVGGFSASLALTGLMFVAILGLLMATSESDREASTTAGDLISFALMLASTSAFVFEAVALVWLLRFAGTLPLAPTDLLGRKVAR